MYKLRKTFIALMCALMVICLYQPVEVHAVAKMSLAQLKAKFPHGKYWNHVGSSKNNPDGWTNTPCRHHGYEESGCSFTGSCGCNNVGHGTYAIQCAGFAYKLGLDAFGSHPKSWKKYAGSSARSYVKNSLKAGDLCRINNDGHSIFITGVSGSTVTFADCNRDGQCVITWGRQISKSQLMSKLTYVRVAPSTFSKYDFTISYDNNGGSGKISNSVVGYEAYFTLPSSKKMTKAGHTLTGFNLYRQADKKYQCEDGKFRTKEEIDQNNIQLKEYESGDYIQASKAWTDSPSKQKKYTFVANWKPNTYTLTYLSEDGVGEMTDQEALYGQPIILNTNAYQKDHYTFGGWNVYSQKNEKWLYVLEDQYAWFTKGKETEGYTQVILSDQQEVTSIPAKNKDIIELHAHWNADTMTVNYEGGLFAEGEMTQSIITYGTESKLSPNLFTKKHFDFIGWNVYSEIRSQYLYSYEGELIWSQEFMAPENASKVILTDESDLQYIPIIANDEITMIASWNWKHTSWFEMLFCNL